MKQKLELLIRFKGKNSFRIDKLESVYYITKMVLYNILFTWLVQFLTNFNRIKLKHWIYYNSNSIEFG